MISIDPDFFFFLKTQVVGVFPSPPFSLPVQILQGTTGSNLPQFKAAKNAQFPVLVQLQGTRPPNTPFPRQK